MANRETLSPASTPDRHRIAIIVRVVSCGLLLFFLDLGLCCGQDDPFGMPNGFPGFDDESPPVDAGKAADDEGPPETPLSRQLEQQARRGSVSLSESAAALARIGYWGKANELLTAASSRGIDDATLSEMGRRLGPALMIRMRQRDDLSEKSRDLLRRISAATTKVAQSPARIVKAIDQLDSQSTDTQLAALRTLLAGGDSSVQELVRAAVAKDPVAPRDEILRVLMRFGPTSFEALERLALYGKPEIRKRAIDALTRMGHQPVILDLLTALHATDSSEAEMNSAAQHLMESGASGIGQSLPDHGHSLRLLVHDLRARRNALLVQQDVQQTETLWTIDEGLDRVRPQMTKTIFKRYRDVADAAARVRRIGNLPPEIEQTALMADLSYRVLVDPDWGDEDGVKTLLQSYGDDVSAAGISGAIDQSLRQNDVPALVALMRIIQTKTDLLDRRALLHGSGANSSPLVKAVDHPNARVRYEAAVAIADLLPSVAGYPGSSRVRLTLDEMRSLGQRPIALLVETRPEVMVVQENLLNLLGYEVLVAGDVRKLERLAAAGGDVRLIVSKTQLADLPPIELVDRVRRHDRARDIPIVFYGQNSEGLRNGRWDAPTMLIDRPVTPAAFFPVHEEMDQRRRLPALTNVDRQRYRRIAAEALAELATL